MVAKVQTVQDTINKRAKEKLEKDLRFLSELYRRENYKYNMLFDGIELNIGTDLKPENIRVINIFSDSYRFYKRAYEKNLPKYIEEETKLFFEELEKLKERVEELSENVENVINYI